MTDALLTGADASTEVPLKRRLRRAERARQTKALALVLPLLIFLLFTFAGPIAGMLWRSVGDREVRQVLPQTVAALANWDGKDLPDEKAYAALASDILAARASGTIAIAAKRLNYAQNGFRTILTSTGRDHRSPAGSGHLPRRFRAHLPHQPQCHGTLPDPRLPGRLSPGDAAARPV